MSLTIDPTTSCGPTSAQLQLAAARGAGYLLRNLQSSGKFVYQRNARTGRPVRGQYNLLRHFGSLWAMLDVSGDDPLVREKVIRGMHWAVERYYVRTRRGGAFRKRDWLATGCSGLALLAFHRLPDRPSELDDICTELAEYLLAVRIDDRADSRHLDFQHKIALDGPLADGICDDVTRPPLISPFRSNYYTGEILFGLITHGVPVAASMHALRERNYGVAERSHWMMYAIRHFVQNTGTDRRSTVEMIEWSGRIAASVLASTHGSRNARSAPSACRVEAQVQFLELTRRYADELAGRADIAALEVAVREQVRADCALLLHLQDMRTGGFIGSATDPIMQIDGTQHAISALSGAAPLLD
jgi:hypothetical protein